MPHRDSFAASLVGLRSACGPRPAWLRADARCCCVVAAAAPTATFCSLPFRLPANAVGVDGQELTTLVHRQGGRQGCGLGRYPAFPSCPVDNPCLWPVQRSPNGEADGHPGLLRTSVAQRHSPQPREGSLRIAVPVGAQHPSRQRPSSLPKTDRRTVPPVEWASSAELHRPPTSLSSSSRCGLARSNFSSSWRPWRLIEAGEPFVLAWGVTSTRLENWMNRSVQLRAESRTAHER